MGELYSDTDPKEVFSKVEDELVIKLSQSSDKIKSLIILLHRIIIDPNSNEKDCEKAASLLLELESMYEDRKKDEGSQKISSAGFVDFTAETIPQESSPLLSGLFSYYHANLYGTSVSIKEIPEQHSDYMAKELSVVRGLHHPYCLECLGYCDHGLVYAPFRTTLHDLIYGSVLKINDRFRLAYQLASAVSYLHSNGIIHQNLKPPTIFIHHNGDIKLAEFDLSGFASEVIEDQFAGTPMYMSPEKLLFKPYTSKNEVYSFGLILYEIITGGEVFAGVTTVNELTARQRISPMLPFTDADYSTTPGDGKPPKELFELAEKCYSFHPENRPDMPTVVQAIRDICIRYFVHGIDSAERFWKVASCYSYCESVPLQQFIDDMRVEPQRPIEQTLKKALPFFSSTLSISQFYLLCCWFPDFFWDKTSFSVMEQVVFADWFCFKKDVKQRLKPTASSFVICPCPDDCLSSPFVLYTKVDDKINQHKIKRECSEKGDPILIVPSFCDLSFRTILLLANHVCDKMRIACASFPE